MKHWALTALAVGLLCASSGMGGTGKGDKERLQGVWKAVAGENSKARPSSRASLTKMAPASSAPWRRTTAKMFSVWQRRI